MTSGQKRVLGASMNNQQLRKIALPLILFFSISTVTAPARAIIPLVASGVMFIAEGGTAANALAALTVGTAAGIVYLGSQSGGAGTKAGSVMDIPVGVGRDRPMDTPPGYTSPVSNNAQPVPPSSVAAIAGYKNYTGDYPIYSTYNESQQAFCNIYSAALIANSCNSTPNAASCDFSCVGGAGGSTSRVNTCQAGYTVSGSSCVLSNAALVQKPADGRCQILSTISAFTIDPNDPECGSAALANAGVTVGSTSITAGAGANSKGSSSLVINADGTRTLTQTQANADGKTSTVTTVVFTPAASGGTATITGTSTTIVNGQGSLVGSTPTTAPIEFPTDYNREVTQTAIKTDLDAIKTSLDADSFSRPAETNDNALPLATTENKKITDMLDESVSSYDNFKLLDWSTWVPVMPAASCTPLSGSVMGKTLTWDLCPYVAKLTETIGWLLSVFAVWSVINVMFRGRSA